MTSLIGIPGAFDEGQLVISTVGEYCDFMVKMGQKNAKAVEDILTSKTGIRKRPRD